MVVLLGLMQQVPVLPLLRLLFHKQLLLSIELGQLVLEVHCQTSPMFYQ